jgi:hypothetical protein
VRHGRAVAVLVCSYTASTSGRPALPPSPGIEPAVTASPSATASTISLAAIQRLDSRVGFVSAWTGAGPGLAETTDAGATWRRIAIPSSRVTSLRFIDERVGWACAFEERNAPQLACHQAARRGGGRAEG